MPTTRLLLIEDDPDVAEMLLTYFEAGDYAVYHADTGLDGIELARAKYPQVILLDLMLPDIDGYEVCLRLRQASLTRYIPIIFLTQRDERADKVKGLELGADDYVTKPFDVDELRLRVMSVIRRATRENLHEQRTGLPTAALVEEELARREQQGQPYKDIRLVINGFKAYNDVYGFLAGNEIFAFVTRIIQETVHELGTPDDFIGLLGDEFVVLTSHPNADALHETIARRFEEGVKAFYSFADVDRGGVILDPDTPQARLVPLMQLIPLQAEL